MVFFIAWVVMALIFVLHLAGLWWIYQDAKAMGEEQPILWAVLALFASFPVGLLIYFLVVRNGKWRCPSCGRQNVKHEATCRGCGEPMTSAASPSGPPTWVLGLILGLMVILVFVFLAFFVVSVNTIDELGGRPWAQWQLA